MQTDESKDEKCADKAADKCPSYRSCLFFLLILGSAAMIFLSSTASASLDEAYGTVTNVVDGSTFDVKIDMADSRAINSVERVILTDISSPEMEALHGPAARDFTFSVLMGKRVYLDIDDLSDDGRDSEGRLICVVYLTGVYGQPIPYPNFNLLLVEAGYADISNRTDNEFDPANWMDEYQSEDSSQDALQRLEENIRERLEGGIDIGTGIDIGSSSQESGSGQQNQDGQQNLEENPEQNPESSSGESDSNSTLLSRIEDTAKEELNQTAQSAWSWLRAEIKSSALELVNSSL